MLTAKLQYPSYRNPRKSYGGSHIVMSCKQLRGDMNYAWPTAGNRRYGRCRRSRSTLRQRSKRQGQPAKVLPHREAEYNKLFCNPYNAARYGYIDDVIEPSQHPFPRYPRPAAACHQKGYKPAKKTRQHTSVINMKRIFTTISVALLAPLPPLQSMPRAEALCVSTK